MNRLALLLVFVLSACSADIARAILAVPDLVGLAGVVVNAAQPDQQSGQHCDQEKGCVNDGTP